MKIFYLFRSDIKHLEYYHSYITLDEFKNKCHDFYLLMPLEFLKMGVFDKAIIWRLTDVKRDDIVFKFKNEKGKEVQFIQKFCKSFNCAFDMDRPNVSLFRGGFKEYDILVNKVPGFFGKTLYLGASRRFNPSFGGKYDIILYESELDLELKMDNDQIYKRFFKTANSKIFYSLNKQPTYDIIWPWKYTSDHRKGELFFLESIKNHPGLQSLKIYHCGNEPKKAKKLFDKYGVNNIVCDDIKHYHDMNEILNNGVCGLMTSDKEDGCPRLSTEIMSCCIPLLIRNKTRILDYYQGYGNITYNNPNDLYSKFIFIKENRVDIINHLKKRLESELSMRKMCEMNIEE